MLLAILLWGEKPSLDMSPSSTGAETGMAAVGNDSVQGIWKSDILPCAKVLGEPSTRCLMKVMSQSRTQKKTLKLLHQPRHILLHGLHGRQYRQLRWGCFRCFPFCHSCDLGFLAEAPQQTLCLKCIYPHGQSRLEVNLFQWTWSTYQCLQPNCLGSLALGQVKLIHWKVRLFHVVITSYSRPWDMRRAKN